MDGGGGISNFCFSCLLYSLELDQFKLISIFFLNKKAIRQINKNMTPAGKYAGCIKINQNTLTIYVVEISQTAAGGGVCNSPALLLVA